MDYRFTYLILGLLFTVIWVSLFLWRKDTRTQMLLVSIIGALAGPVMDHLYIQDYWVPLNITSTKIGIVESVLVGFMMCGVATVLYEDLFRKKIVLKRAGVERKIGDTLHVVLLSLLTLGIAYTSFYFLHLNSLIASLLAFIIPTIIILYLRKDLIMVSLITGILLLLVSTIVYSILELITPGWVLKFWYFKNVPEIIIFNMPIDDVFWYFFAGAYLGPLYEYWREGRFVKVTSAQKR